MYFGENVRKFFGDVRESFCDLRGQVADNYKNFEECLHSETLQDDF